MESESGDGDLMRGHAESVTGGDAPCRGDILPRPVEVAEGRFRGEGRVGSEKFWSEARDGGEVAFFDGGEEGGDGGGAE